MEELFEATTWAQLNYHMNPVGLLNINGFYDPIVAWIERATQDGFIRARHKELVQVDTSPAALLDKMATAEVPDLSQWLPGQR